MFLRGKRHNFHSAAAAADDDIMIIMKIIMFLLLVEADQVENRMYNYVNWTDGNQLANCES